MSLRSYRLKRVTPKWQEMAEMATKWASSEEGLVAYDQCVKVAHEMTQPLRDAMRIGMERI